MGTIGFERFAGSIDPNGVETDDFSLRFIEPTGGNRSTAVVIDREECAVANPQGLGSVGWQPLSAGSR